MAEWLKAHAWKACLGETLTWVRIPLSPPAKSKTYACYQVRQRASHFSLAQFSTGIGTYRTSHSIMKASSRTHFAKTLSFRSGSMCIEN